MACIRARGCVTASEHQAGPHHKSPNKQVQFARWQFGVGEPGLGSQSCTLYILIASVAVNSDSCET